MLSPRQGDQVEQISARTILGGWRQLRQWGGLAKRTGAQLDRVGRVIVEPDLGVPGHPNIFVVGDLASFRIRMGTATRCSACGNAVKDSMSLH